MYLNNKQSYFFCAILVFILGFAACEKGILGVPLVPFGEKIEVGQSKSIYFGSDSLSGVKVNIINIEDSRCPEDVDCIRAGEVKVKVSVLDAEKNSASFDLYFGEKSKFKADTVLFSINQKKYKAILFGVSPLPNSKENTKDLKAEITLIK